MVQEVQANNPRKTQKGEVTDTNTTVMEPFMADFLDNPNKFIEASNLNEMRIRKCVVDILEKRLSIKDGVVSQFRNVAPENLMEQLEEMSGNIVGWVAEGNLVGYESSRVDVSLVTKDSISDEGGLLDELGISYQYNNVARRWKMMNKGVSSFEKESFALRVVSAVKRKFSLCSSEVVSLERKRQKCKVPSQAESEQLHEVWIELSVEASVHPRHQL